MTSIMKNMPLFCQNFKNGCREIACLQNHPETDCFYRMVYCPDLYCDPVKYPFHKIRNHFVQYHKIQRMEPNENFQNVL